MHRLQRQRTLAFYSQNGCCFYCGSPMWLHSPAELPLPPRMARLLRCTAEHLLARQDGGTDRRSNIVAACWRCNQGRHRRKTDCTPEAFIALVRTRLRHGRWWPGSLASHLRALTSSKP